MKENEWFHDHLLPDLLQLHRIKQVIYSGKTPYQSVEFAELGPWGRCLILDGKIQSSEWDEAIYHQSLVHPSMIAHPSPRSVFIGGGGEGATLREALRYESVKRAVMVDLDRDVVELCRQHLPTFHQGSFDDPRVELLFTDAMKYLQESEEKFDVIILDLPEPIEGGPAYLLSTREFYEMVRDRLADGGTVSLQAGASTWGNHQCFTAVVNTLKKVFPLVFPYQVCVPSYCGMWGFAFASASVIPPDAAEVDSRVASRIDKELLFYDGLTHHGMFSIPKNLRRAIAEEKTVITVDNPFYIYTP
jgi:spermidine synthase